MFPDFNTITPANDVYSRSDIFQESIADGLVPVFILGRPSCPAMRLIYTQIVIPLAGTEEELFHVYHLENSVEAHANNGYRTPYYDYNQGVPYAIVQIPSFNGNNEFNQPMNGEELLIYGANFISKMEAVGVSGISSLAELTVLLDSPEGGFTEALGGPSLIWVVNPITGEIVYEETALECLSNVQNPECTSLKEEFLLSIMNVRNSMNQTVSISAYDPPYTKTIELKSFNFLGQGSQANTRIYYDPVTKRKFIHLSAD